MIRNIAKLFTVTVVLTGFLHVATVLATVPQPVVWMSSTGSDNNPCTAALPCASFGGALSQLTSGGQINCIGSPAPNEGGLEPSTSFTLDCAGVFEAVVPNFGALLFASPNQAVKIRNLTISGAAGGYPAIKVIGGGTLILENCVFENFSGTALDIEPTGPLNLVIKNSRVSNNTGGVLIKPASGGSVTATFDGVTIVNNTGGLRTDSTNGAVRVDVSNSTISNNTANGMVVLSASGTGGMNMVTLKSDVIGSNGQAGIVANGANAGVLVNSTVLDSNTTGATSAVSGGRILTYGNNSTIGIPGSGFTGTAPLN